LGHIRHLQAAKAAGDYLVVTVTADRYVRKGPGRPAFTEHERAEALRGLACVDEVQISRNPTAAEDIRLIRPAIFAKGPDYSETTLDSGEREALAEVDGKLLITETEKWSSTALLTPRPVVSEEIRAYLSGLQASPADVLAWLDKALALKVLVIGDGILDIYRYGNASGKAGKEPILITKFAREERFVGGSEAVAQHARACANDVDYVAGPRVVKRRFVETYPFQKIFGEDEIDEQGTAAAARHVETNKHLADYDLVIVADYGHGFMTPSLINALQARSKYLAVNVQDNAGNHGFNTIGKYQRADFISISERELRLDARDQATDVRELMQRAATARDGTVLVTRGAQGCMASRRSADAEAPAFASHTVDRMGAGDAVFGVTACCAAVGMPLELLCYVAAVVGTQAVGIVGNARYIERESLRTALTAWLS
jgi:cytidyltransferase-like protein